MKLACIGPLSPRKSGVADFSESLLPFLAERCEIKLFTDGYSPSPTPILKRFAVADISEFLSKPAAFDAVLYHMGNQYVYHKNVFNALCSVPGIVLLHDCVLNQFFSKYALERGNFGLFRNLLELCYPGIDSKELTTFYKAQGDPYRFPMGGVAAMCARGTIVMNEYGRGITMKEAPSANVAKINFPYLPHRSEIASISALGEKLGIPEKKFVITAIGHMTPAKRIPVALEAFQKFHSEFPDSVFLLAGQISSYFPLEDRIADGSFGDVRYLGYLERAELQGLVEMTDVCINLRYPSNGEMSSTLIDMLGRGKVVAVSNYAQFAEFPDAACIKIDVGPDEGDNLANELLNLAKDEARWRHVGEEARKYISQHHQVDVAADSIVSFIEKNRAAEPILSHGKLMELLSPDGLWRRSRQTVEYNARRILNHLQEQGLARTVRQAFHRAFARAT